MTRKRRFLLLESMEIIPNPKVNFWVLKDFSDPAFRGKKIKDSGVSLTRICIFHKRAELCVQSLRARRESLDRSSHDFLSGLLRT